MVEKKIPATRAIKDNEKDQAKEVEWSNTKITEDTKRRVKRYSADIDKTMQEIVEEAVTGYLDNKGY